MENLLTTDACTLPTTARPLRLAEFDALFADTVTGVERRATSVRLTLAGSVGLRDRVRDLTNREAACCSFFTFTLSSPETDIGTLVHLDISVPPERRSILDALAARAQELSG